MISDMTETQRNVQKRTCAYCKYRQEEPYRETRTGFDRIQIFCPMNYCYTEPRNYCELQIPGEALESFYQLKGQEQYDYMVNTVNAARQKNIKLCSYEEYLKLEDREMLNHYEELRKRVGKDR